MTDDDDKFDDGEYIAEKACEIYKKGHQNGVLAERKRFKEYFTKCANQLDFGNDSPNTVIHKLIELMDDAIKDIMNKTE